MDLIVHRKWEHHQSCILDCAMDRSMSLNEIKILLLGSLGQHINFNCGFGARKDSIKMEHTFYICNMCKSSIFSTLPCPDPKSSSNSNNTNSLKHEWRWEWSMKHNNICHTWLWCAASSNTYSMRTLDVVVFYPKAQLKVVVCFVT